MNTQIATSEYEIHAYSLCCMRQALKLEILGHKVRRGQTTYAFLKKAYGFKGNKLQVVAQLADYMEAYRAKHIEQLWTLTQQIYK